MGYGRVEGNHWVAETRLYAIRRWDTDAGGWVEDGFTDEPEGPARLVAAVDRRIPLAHAREMGLLDDESSPVHVGGGWYELPDGSKVQGKEEAEAAMKSVSKSEVEDKSLSPEEDKAEATGEDEVQSTETDEE